MLDSATVGSSGATAERLRLVTASARSLPALIIDMPARKLLRKTCTCPDTRSVIACPAPLYGTCTMSIPAILLKSSMPRCGPLPLPDDAYESWPGCDFAKAMSSLIVFAGTDGCTVITKGYSASRDTGAKSPSVSYGNFE